MLLPTMHHSPVWCILNKLHDISLVAGSHDVYKTTITNSSLTLGITCYYNILQAKSCWLLVDHHHPRLLSDGVLTGWFSRGRDIRVLQQSIIFLPLFKAEFLLVKVTASCTCAVKRQKNAT